MGGALGYWAAKGAYSTNGGKPMEWFKFRFEWLELLNVLGADERGWMINIISNYLQNGTMPDLDDYDRAFKVVWLSIKNDIDTDAEYTAKKQENGRKGGIAKAENTKQAVADCSNVKQAVADCSNVKQAVAIRSKNIRIQEDKNTREQEDVYCAEQSSTPPVIALPLNDGTAFDVTEEQAEEWAKLYPSVDVAQQLRNMRGWLDSNPKKRKTRGGIKQFCTSWLSREQDRGGTAHAPPSAPKRVIEHSYSQRPIDPHMDDIPEELLREVEAL